MHHAPVQHQLACQLISPAPTPPNRDPPGTASISTHPTPKEHPACRRRRTLAEPASASCTSSPSETPSSHQHRKTPTSRGGAASISCNNGKETPVSRTWRSATKPQCSEQRSENGGGGVALFRDLCTCPRLLGRNGDSPVLQGWLFEGQELLGLFYIERDGEGLVVMLTPEGRFFFQFRGDLCDDVISFGIGLLREKACTR